MALKKGDKTNFATLEKACKAGHLALMECQDTDTGEYRAVICAVGYDNGEYVFTPLGHLCTGNPFEQYTPPTP
jgi:hypothetical protein